MSPLARLLARAVVARSAGGRAGFALRVEFDSGEHEFWAWRTTEGKAERLGQRRRNYPHHCHIIAMSVVPMLERDFDIQSGHRCRAGNCPAAKGLPS